MVTFVQQTVRIALLLLAAGAASAQDISQLAGVAPGRVMREVEASASNVRSTMPFVFFGAGVSCNENHGNFQELMVELVHFKLDAELSSLMGQRQ